jgi:Asp-tRNA(Asn)/Glu-tRNA(Gln) amidotransferase C subunit
MDNFLWHKISKEEQEKIKKEAKAIMDNFGKALEKVEAEVSGDSSVKRKLQTRKETRAHSKKEFRDIFFENAHSKSQDYIKAERGKWK